MCVVFSTGKKFENTEMFGQYPLQVNGFKDLHECLEAAMVEGEIESLHSAENSAKSGQEVSVLSKSDGLYTRIFPLKTFYNCKSPCYRKVCFASFFSSSALVY